MENSLANRDVLPESFQYVICTICASRTVFRGCLAQRNRLQRGTNGELLKRESVQILQARIRILHNRGLAIVA